MFLFAFVLGFLSLNICSCNRQQQAAVDAIQKSVFGGASDEPVLMPLVSDDDWTRSRTKEGDEFVRKSYTFQDLGQMNVETAPKQKVIYRPSGDNIPVIDTCPDVKCHLTIALVLDSSGSVGYHNFGFELDFVKTLLEIMAVKASDYGVVVCTGIVVYSTRVSVVVNPCCQNTVCTVVDQFNQDQIPYQPGSTNTHGALKVARQMLQATSSFKKVALLITDGKSNTGGSPNKFAKQMRMEDGIDIVSLGVGEDVNENELKSISGFEFITRIDYFDEFHELASLLLEANYVGSEYELESTFGEICGNDKSTFSNTCERSDSSEEDENCAWGSWSNCVSKHGSCTQRRTCKLTGKVVKEEQRACECEDTVQKGSFMGSLRKQAKSRKQSFGKRARLRNRQ